MKATLIAACVLGMFSSLCAEVFVFERGKSPPKNTKPNGLKGIREHLKEICGTDTYLHTDRGDIWLREEAWRDKDGRFTIGWESEDGEVQKVYFYQGTPKWQSGQMKPLQWSRDGVIKIDLKTGKLAGAKNSEQTTGRPATSPESNSEGND